MTSDDPIDTLTRLVAWAEMMGGWEAPVWADAQRVVRNANATEILHAGLSRMWINQPSTLQPYHTLHGQRVLAMPERGETWRVYFLSGEVVSQQISKAALSSGWARNKRLN